MMNNPVSQCHSLLLVFVYIVVGHVCKSVILYCFVEIVYGSDNEKCLYDIVPLSHNVAFWQQNNIWKGGVQKNKKIFFINKMSQNELKNQLE